MTITITRAQAERELERVGKCRRRLLAQLAELDETVTRPVVLRALEARVPQRVIESLSGVNPRTARKWRDRASDTG